MPELQDHAAAGDAHSLGVSQAEPTRSSNPSSDRFAMPFSQGRRRNLSTPVALTETQEPRRHGFCIAQRRR
jgi:hypothetical protein